MSPGASPAPGVCAGEFPVVGRFGPAGRARSAQRRVTRRHLQIALGLLWLLDGGLQLQPFMYSRNFLALVMEPAAQGQPHVIAVGVLDLAHLMSGHLALYNTGIAAIQILIGIGLIVPQTVKPALIISFGWAFGVWAFGEGLGLLLTGTANPLTGAPGAVLLYVLAGLLVWPADRPLRGPVASQGLLNDRGGRLAWAGLWCGLAALSLLPANLASGGSSGLFASAGRIAPGPLADLDTTLGRASAGHGFAVAILIAALELGIGAGMLNGRWRNTAAALGAAFALAVWVTTQGLGGLTTGHATDPNSGPLLVLLAAALYVPATAPARPRRRPERAAGPDEPAGRKRAGRASRPQASDRTEPTIEPERKPDMRKGPFRTLATAVFLAVVLTISGLIVAGHSARSSASTRPAAAAVHFNGKELAFHDAMRQLWEEHVLWTRLFIVSDVFNSPDLAPTTTRLLANQVDIGNAVKPFYGSANGDHLTALLNRHILLAGTIIAEAKAGNSQGVKQAERAWYANANQIAAFLHGLNPAHWPLAALRTMMHMHLSLTLTEAVDQLTGNYARSVHDFDVVENEILTMADTLSNGIIAQFPHDFA